jgi:uncharacterized membrane protein
MQHRFSGPNQSGTLRQRLPHFNLPFSSHHQQTGPLQRYRTYGSDRSQQVIKALGWFSLGLGVAQLLAPRAISRAIGIAERPVLMRTVGMREIAAGVGILSQRQRGPWLWTRVAGDAMDLTLLGLAARRSGSVQRNRIGMATAAVAGVAMLDVLSSVQNRKDSLSVADTSTGPVHVTKSIIVNRSPEECYRFWRDFQNFPHFMKHLESIQSVGDNRWHWKSKAPMGASVEWDAEITADRPNELLAWRSVEGSDVENAGTVKFERAIGDRGTIVRVDLHYSPPSGKTGVLIAKLFGEEPEQQIDDDLRRFKWLIETGEIPTTVGQPSGKRDMMTRLLIKKGVPG